MNLYLLTLHEACHLSTILPLAKTSRGLIWLLAVSMEEAKGEDSRCLWTLGNWLG